MTVKHAAEILKALPHRYPFLMVDRVVEIIPGKRAVAIKNITHKTPQTYIIEAMAQVGAIAAAPDGAAETPSGGDGGMLPGYLAGLNGTVFGKRPKAGDRLVLTLDFRAKMGGLVRFWGTATVDGEVAAESGLTFSIPERE